MLIYRVKMLKWKLKFELQILLHFHFCGGILQSSVLRFLGNWTIRKISCNIKVLRRKLKFPQSSVISNTKKNPNFSTLVKHLDIGKSRLVSWNIEIIDLLSMIIVNISWRNIIRYYTMIMKIIIFFIQSCQNRSSTALLWPSEWSTAGRSSVEVQSSRSSVEICRLKKKRGKWGKAQ